MRRFRWIVPVLALAVSVSLGGRTVYAYWVDTLQSSWNLTVQQELTIKVIGLSADVAEEEEPAAVDTPNEEVPRDRDPGADPPPLGYSSWWRIRPDGDPPRDPEQPPVTTEPAPGEGDEAPPPAREEVPEDTAKEMD